MTKPAGARVAVLADESNETSEPRVFSDLRRHFRNSRVGIAGLAITSGFVIIGILGPWIPFLKDPTEQDLSSRLVPPVGFGGTWSHPLGTDQLGRDLLARVVESAQVSLLVGIVAVTIAMALGVVLGLIAGYFGGWTDSAITSIADIHLAFPGILIGLVLFAAFGPSVWIVIAVISLTGWMVFTRVTRNLVLTLKATLFVEAAELNGSTVSRIMLHHLLPNLTNSIITLSVLELAAAILSESVFSFLGFGVQPPQSSWGLMIQQGKDYIVNAWWIVTFSGLAIALTVLGISLLSLWLQSFNDLAEREQVILELPGL